MSTAGWHRIAPGLYRHDTLGTITGARGLPRVWWWCAEGAAWRDREGPYNSLDAAIAAVGRATAKETG